MLISFRRFLLTYRRPLRMAPLLVPACALANNALNLSGYGAESEAMGGADVAVARDTFAANINPAGLTQATGRMLDLYVAPWYSNASHTDQYGNYRKDSSAALGGWVAGGYAQPLAGTALTAGAALFLQGGAGWDYKHLNTQFGTRDEASAQFGLFRLAPALAWKVNDRLSVGASAALNYASGAQTLFPNTSTPQFPGITFKDANGIGLSGRLGLQYRPMEDVTIGLTYGSRTKVPLKNGMLRANFSAIGAGVVRYDDAQLKGFRLPQEVALGIAFRPIKPLLVSVQDKWYDWSQAITDMTLLAKSPRSANPLVPAQLQLTSHINLRDQHVLSIGFAYDYDERTALLGGVNYGPRALPDENLNPVFAIIQGPHYMFGIKRGIDSEWNATGAVEYVPFQQVTNPTTNYPWGTNSVERHFGLALHLMASRHWD